MIHDRHVDDLVRVDAEVRELLLERRNHLRADQIVEVERIFSRRGAARHLGAVEDIVAVAVIVRDGAAIGDARDHDILGAPVDDHLHDLVEHLFGDQVELVIGFGLGDGIASRRRKVANVIPACCDQVKAVTRVIAVERIPRCVRLLIEIGNGLVALDDVRAPIGKVEIVPAGVARERIERDSEPGVVIAEREDRLADEPDRLVADEVCEDVAVAEAALEIAFVCRRSAVWKRCERQRAVKIRELQSVSGIDQAVAEHIYARVRHHALLAGATGCASDMKRLVPHTPVGVSVHPNSR